MKKIVDAIKERDIAKIKLLISKKQYIEQIYAASSSVYILEEVLKDDSQLEILTFLLNQPFLKPEVQNQKFFTLACKNGYLDYVKAFIATGKIKIDFEFNLAFRKAVEYNQIEMVKYLLSFNITNPRAKNDEAIRIAAKKRHLEIIELLLEQDLNIVSKNNSFIRRIVQHGLYDIFIKVFNNKNYNSRSTFIAAWEEAALKKNEKMINFLMDRKDYNIVDKAHELMKSLIKDDNLNYLRILIKKMTEEDKSKHLYFALKEACRYNKINIFKYLVEEEKLNPFTGRGKYLKIALEEGHSEIFKEVYKYKNEKLEKSLFYIIRVAILNNRLEELNILLKEKNGKELAHKVIEKEESKRIISNEVKTLLRFNDF